MTDKLADDPFYQTREKTWFDIYGQDEYSNDIDDYLLTKVKPHVTLHVRRQIRWPIDTQIKDQLHWRVYYQVEQKILTMELFDEL